MKRWVCIMSDCLEISAFVVLHPETFERDKHTLHRFCLSTFDRIVWTL